MKKLVFLQIFFLLPAFIYYLEAVLSTNKGYGAGIYKAIHFSFFLTSLIAFLIGIKIFYYYLKIGVYKTCSLNTKIMSIVLSVLAFFFMQLESDIVYYMLRDFFYCLRYCFV